MKRRITKIAMFAGLLAVADSIPAYAADSPYQTYYEIPQAEQDNYTMLVEDLGEYEVCAGDSLWSISEKLFGNGADYMKLAEQNADIIKNPDLIYPKCIFN